MFMSLFKSIIPVKRLYIFYIDFYFNILQKYLVKTVDLIFSFFFQEYLSKCENQLFKDTTTLVFFSKAFQKELYH